MNAAYIRSRTMSEIVRRVVACVHPLRVILFGSTARKQAHKDSDIDLLVVMPSGTRRLETAQRLHMAMLGVRAPVDFVVATREDVERHRDNIGLIYRTILREGKQIYAR